MDKKKILAIAAVVVIAGFCTVGLFNNKQIQSQDDNVVLKNDIIQKKPENVDKDVVNKKENKKEIKESKNKVENISEKKDKNIVVKTNLYNDLPSSSLPLSAVAGMADMPKNIQIAISKIAENGNIYMVKRYKDKILVVTDSPENIRHRIGFTEINLNNGHQTQTTFGYNDKIKDSDNDIWEYSEDTKQPVRHTKYNSDGYMEFVEVWNYEPNNPVKYEMKDAEGRVMSMTKEELHDGTNLRVEHLIYDKAGHTKMNISTTFDGQDIKRFTYYNADKPAEGCSIFSEYSNGLKTKEILYTSDLKVMNSYTADYKDGNREEIIKWDSGNKEVQKFVPNDSL